MSCWKEPSGCWVWVRIWASSSAPKAPWMVIIGPEKTQKHSYTLEHAINSHPKRLISFIKIPFDPSPLNQMDSHPLHAVPFDVFVSPWSSMSIFLLLLFTISFSPSLPSPGTLPGDFTSRCSPSVSVLYLRNYRALSSTSRKNRIDIFCLEKGRPAQRRSHSKKNI